MIRVAAVGDVHVGRDSRGRLRPHLKHLPERADLFLVAGDLTRRGLPEEAEVLAEELREVADAVPTFAVLGNHDFESGREQEVVEVLAGVDVQVLEGEAMVVAVDGTTVGIAGAKGFGGGFPGASGSEFGEPEMKAFMRHSAEAAGRLDSALAKIAGEDVRIALMHYSPTEDTLDGERLEIYPFLGSYFLAEVLDRHAPDLALHGHAHAGSEKGLTAGGVCVRNVAQPVLGRAYATFCLDRGRGDVACEDATATGETGA